MHKRRVTTLTLIAVGLVAAACAPTRVAVRHPAVRPVAAVVTTTTTTLPPPTTVPRPAPIVVNRSAPLPHPTTTTAPPAAVENGTGLASWYDPPWGGYTFASRTMPRGTVVTFAYHGRTVTATCRDYGPAVWTGRQFDLSRAAFEVLASTGAGVIEVSWHYG